MAHPAFEIGDERVDLILPHSMPLFVRQTIEGALETEDCIDASHRLDRQRRFRQLSQLEEVAPAVCPTQRLGQRGRLSSPGI